VTSPAITSTLAAPDAAVDAVSAGIDLIEVGGGESEREAVHQALLAAVRTGAISRERLDEAVLRNLEAKDAAGVLPDAGAEAGGGDAGNGGSSGDG
jgi:beta-glucosidase-like glycosyl hydrolase